MKTIIGILAAMTMISNIAFSDITLSNELSFRVSVEHISRVSDNALEFDIVLHNTSAEDTDIRYALGQYFFEFNPSVANGGSLAYSIVASDLPENLRPRNASVKDNLLRLATNQVSPDRENLPVISKKSEGFLAARMRLVTSAGRLSDDDPNIRSAGQSHKFRTRVITLLDNRLAEITNSDATSGEYDSGKEITESNSTLPAEFALEQNYPNPFNPATKIRYALPVDSKVSLKVYDNTGREIAVLLNDVKAAGRYELSFNAGGLPTGVYYLRIQATDFSKVIKMMLIK